MGSQILKNGIIKASGSTVNPNICTWLYSRNPNLPNTAGNTILSITDYTEYTRYTATTAGTSGGKYGYPCGSGDASVLVEGTVYTWSCEIRSSVAFTGNSNLRFGFEGGGMISGSAFTCGIEWKRISKTWTQTTSKAFVMYPAGSYGDGEWIELRNLKCEVGSIATPFTYPSGDTSKYVGTNHGMFETVLYPAKVGNDWVQANEFIEI